MFAAFFLKSLSGAAAAAAETRRASRHSSCSQQKLYASDHDWRFRVGRPARRGKATPCSALRRVLAGSLPEGGFVPLGFPSRTATPIFYVLSSGVVFAGRRHILSGKSSVANDRGRPPGSKWILEGLIGSTARSSPWRILWAFDISYPAQIAENKYPSSLARPATRFAASAAGRRRLRGFSNCVVSRKNRSIRQEVPRVGARGGRSSEP